MAGFGFAGAAAGGQAAIDAQRKQALLEQQAAEELQNALAEREYKRILGETAIAQEKRLSAPKPLAVPEPRFVEGVGPKGEKIGRLVKPEDLMAPGGVPLYNPPTAASTRAPVRVETVDAAGKPVTKFVPEQEAAGQSYPSQPAAATGARAPVRVETMEGGKRVIKFVSPEEALGKTYEDQPPNSSESAQDRLRTARVGAAKGFLDRLDTLRQNINTHVGPQAGLSGIVRQGAAAIGWDPDVAEYERERAAGGRALAVAIMGAQNLSDQDAKAWADMLPGARVDAVTAKRLMDQVRTMLMESPGGPEAAAAPPAGGKTITRARLHQIAVSHNLTDAQAEADAVAHGVTVK